MKYLGVYFDDKLSWNKHIDYIATKMSFASGALHRLSSYILRRALMPVYLMHFHLHYGIILWRNTTKSISPKFQTKQNRIVKLICNKSAKRTRLKPIYDKLYMLNIRGMYKLELAKFMVKEYLHKLPMLCSEYLITLKKDSQYICI